MRKTLKFALELVRAFAWPPCLEEEENKAGWGVASQEGGSGRKGTENNRKQTNQLGRRRGSPGGGGRAGRRVVSVPKPCPQMWVGRRNQSVWFVIPAVFTWLFRDGIAHVQAERHILLTSFGMCNPVGANPRVRNGLLPELAEFTPWKSANSRRRGFPSLRGQPSTCQRTC